MVWCGALGQSREYGFWSVDVEFGLKTILFLMATGVDFDSV